MNEFFHMAGTLAALADPSRLAICLALLDGRARTASELAAACGVSPQTASGHLGKLREAGLLVVEAQGRHRFYRLASFQVGELLESLGEVAALRNSLRRFPQRVPVALREARTCYDHLAGRLGTQLRERLEQRALLVREGAEYRLTANGTDWCRAWQLMELSRAHGGERAFARCCLDWSERTPHVGGILGAALLRHLVERGCLRHGEGRQLCLVGTELALWAELGL